MMKKEKQKITRNEKFMLFRNVIYLAYFKGFVLFLICVLTWIFTAANINILNLYLEDADAVKNAFTQKNHFDYETSEPFKGELKKTVDSILQYALVYRDIDNFDSGDSIYSHIENETERFQSLIENTRYLCAVQLERGDFERSYIENGFIRFDNGKASVDEKRITEYYNKKRDDIIESYKKSIDDNYREITGYLDSLNSVEYAVIIHDDNSVVSNTGIKSIEKLRKYFSDKKHCIIILDSNNPCYAVTSMRDYTDEVFELEKPYEQTFDVCVSFNNGLMFNEECTHIEQRCTDMAKKVYIQAFHCMISLIFATALGVFFISIAGKREYKGAIKYSVSDRLPNDIHVLFHAVIIACMATLIENSAYMILNPHLGTSWITVSPQYFIVRAEICSVILVLMFFAAISAFKRHYKNKTLFSNTIIFRIIRVFRKDSGGEYESLF